MRNASVLKSGIIGYAYRWLRNAGVVAVVSGGGLLASAFYHAQQDLPVEATVTALDIACVITGNSVLTQAYQKEVECSDAEGIIAANPKLPLTVREITYAKLSYQSQSGAAYTARFAAGALSRPDMQRGESVALLIDRDDPSVARPVTTASHYWRGAFALSAGVLMLVMVWFAQLAAGYQNDVAAEVAALERDFRARSTPTAQPRTRR